MNSTNKALDQRQGKERPVAGSAPQKLKLRNFPATNQSPRNKSVFLSVGRLITLVMAIHLLQSKTPSGSKPKTGLAWFWIVGLAGGGNQTTKILVHQERVLLFLVAGIVHQNSTTLPTTGQTRRTGFAQLLAGGCGDLTRNRAFLCNTAVTPPVPPLTRGHASLCNTLTTLALPPYAELLTRSTSPIDEEVNDMRNKLHALLLWFAQKWMTPTTPGWQLGALCYDWFGEITTGKDVRCLYLILPNHKIIDLYYNETMEDLIG